MRKIFAIFTVLLLSAFVFSGPSPAEETVESTMKIMDQFYNGLASIIERNMDMPDNCVREVEKYYANNQAVVTKIRKMSEVAIARAAAIEDNRKTMTNEELEELEKSVSGAEFSGELISQGMEKYSKALEAFGLKHPRHALEIAGKAIQFLPASKPR